MCARPSAVDKPLALPLHVHSPLLMTCHSPAMRPRRNCHLTAPEGKSHSSSSSSPSMLAGYLGQAAGGRVPGVSGSAGCQALRMLITLHTRSSSRSSRTQGGSGFGSAGAAGH